MVGDYTADDYGSMMNIGLAVITFIIIMIFSKVGVATLSRLSILLGRVVGTIIAVFMGRTDFSDVGDGVWVAVSKPFEIGMPTFAIAAILSMLIVILVDKGEIAAVVIAVAEIVGTLVDSRRIADGWRADMLCSAVAPVFGSFSQSA